MTTYEQICDWVIKQAEKAPKMPKELIFHISVEDKKLLEIELAERTHPEIMVKPPYDILTLNVMGIDVKFSTDVITEEEMSEKPKRIRKKK